MNLNLKTGFVIVCLCFSLGCTRSSSTTTAEGSVGNVNVKIESLVKRTVSGNATVSPFLSVAVKNTGTTPAYGLSYEVSPIKNNKPIETVTGNISVDNHKDLGAGANAFIEVVFSKISSHEDYDTLKFDFSWNEQYKSQVNYSIIQ